MVLCVIFGAWLGKGSDKIKDSDYIIQHGSSARIYKKGESVNLNERVGITAHSVKKLTSDVYFLHTGEKVEPLSSEKLIQVKMTLKNFSNKPLPVIPSFQYEIMESEHKRALSAIGGFAKSEIMPNETIEGSIILAVPKSLYEYTLVCYPDELHKDDTVKFKL